MFRKFTVGSCFAGIGGLDLGLEWTGCFETKWQIENDLYALDVLSKHWPNVQKFPDIRTVDTNELTSVDVICGGFPCQDVSIAGKQAGITGSRSGLWKELFRVIRDLRPKYALVENTTGLFSNGFGEVLADLASIGFDAEWTVISACSMGAPHTRERVFVVSYPHERRRWPWVGDSTETPNGKTPNSFTRRSWWNTEPSVDRVVHGFPNRARQLGALGNAVVPQVAHKLGEMILDFEFTDFNDVK